MSLLTASERRAAHIASAIVRVLPRPGARLWTTLMRYTLLFLSEPTQHAGFSIAELRDSPGAAARIDKVIAAINLVSRLDARRADRMRRTASMIVIMPVVSSDGVHWPRPRATAVDQEFVQRATVDEIALVLIHEATHARLMDAGIGYSETIRRRVELACITEEFRFARRLPDAEAWTKHVAGRNTDPDYLATDAMISRKRASVP